MTKSCFQCKKELGRFTLNEYPPNNLKFDGKIVPQNMTDKDVVCHDCYKKIPLNEKHKKFEDTMRKIGTIIGGIFS
jgi:hypothetical protein